MCEVCYLDLVSVMFVCKFFFLMIRRPPRSTLFPYNDALPISEPVIKHHHDTGDDTMLLGEHREGCGDERDRKSTRLNSSHLVISYAVFCLKKKTIPILRIDVSLLPTTLHIIVRSQHRCRVISD